MHGEHSTWQHREGTIWPPSHRQGMSFQGGQCTRESGKYRVVDIFPTFDTLLDGGARDMGWNGASRLGMGEGLTATESHVMAFGHRDQGGLGKWIWGRESASLLPLAVWCPLPVRRGDWAVGVVFLGRHARAPLRSNPADRYIASVAY